MVSAVDSARFHGCWRSGDGVAVEGECGDGAGKEHGRGCWRSGGGVAGMVLGRSMAKVAGGQVSS